MSKYIAVPPKILHNKWLKRLGRIIVPKINSLIVLPLEILATKIPTNGVHAR